MALILVDLAFYVIGISFLIVFATLFLAKIKMAQNRTALEKQLVEPSGAGMAQGMIRNPDGRGVHSDSQESLTWYSRLL